MSALVLAALAAGAAVWLLMPAGRDRLQALAGEPHLCEPRADDVMRALRERVHRHRDDAQRRRHGIDALAALAAELRAGQLPATALVQATTGAATAIWPHAMAAATQRGDVAAGLDIDARTQPSLRALAACWRLAEHTGAGLAESVERIVAGMRADERVRGELQAQLAAPRASARMLALLPVFGVGLGFLMGADPLGWLLGSPLGLTALAAGLALVAAGLWWTRRIIARVEEQL